MITSEIASVSLSTFALIALAEIGDKSQLVCMTLAARHRALPVIIGAATAFLLLNALAVLFGGAIANWVPERILSAIVAAMFAVFGVHALRSTASEKPADVAERRGHGIFMTTLLLILVAEFGDKTQLAVAGLAGSMPRLPVWIGASGALITISALGVWIGRTGLQRLPIHWLHRLSGGLFLIFACIAAWHALA